MLLSKITEKTEVILITNVPFKSHFATSFNIFGLLQFIDIRGYSPSSSLLLFDQQANTNNATATAAATTTTAAAAKDGGSILVTNTECSDVSSNTEPQQIINPSLLQQQEEQQEQEPFNVTGKGLCFIHVGKTGEFLIDRMITYINH